MGKVRGREGAGVGARRKRALATRKGEKEGWVC